MLVSSAALAGGDPCGNLGALASGDCVYEVSGGCEADCTPINFVAACDGQCTAGVDVSCSGGCEMECQGGCDPGHIDCVASCHTSCYAGCDSSCVGAGCVTDCQADCDNRCKIGCDVTLPSCDVSCKAACDASCTVQANVDCHYGCTTNIQGGCTTACQTPKGALFCNGQYVDLSSDATSCLNYLESQGISFSGSCNANGCSGTLGCSAAPTLGVVDEKLGVGAIAGLMMGLGLLISRRRRA
jgi:hypothetical protein